MTATRYHLIEDAQYMEFRLTFSGRLLSTGNDSRWNSTDKKSDHKHAIRMKFHPQLKRLWEITPFLKSGERSGPSAIVGSGSETPSYKRGWLAKKYAMFDWNFVPLVTEQLDLICGIDVLFLRPNKPGAVVDHGDIDGRLKTLLDALSIPDANQDYEVRTKAKGENPLYVLLANDRLITKVSVETDQLLDFDPAEKDISEVRLVITVRLRPYEMHLGNMQFG